MTQIDPLLPERDADIEAMRKELQIQLAALLKLAESIVRLIAAIDTWQKR